MGTIILNAKEKKAFRVLMCCVLFFVLLTLIQDFVRSDIKKYAFYFSESFMFSSFWWLFGPLLFVQYYLVKKTIFPSVWVLIPLMLFPGIIHLFLFPVLVWLLSGIFYYHRFAWLQTFEFTLSEHLYHLVLLYTLPVVFFQFYTKKEKATTNAGADAGLIDNLLVTDGGKKIKVPLSSACYFSASSPYISIHLEGKKYLLTGTLKSMSTQLNPQQFVRIHKSTIININMVTSFTTRHNGDYDLLMKNGATLRVSRNFAAGFKILVTRSTQFTAK